ncbi:MAG: 50S ribosomal protein L17 [Ignavibacteria bacterium GWA2_55_11]|nr:MAG: 50S ribosomal protein L17 [Ignavibacteria bacterium GWA2_55_11]OGU74622.1 MAG: 50S ribosomal protein L17 [Ignavibacteria bacterium RIFCSPLOWO2_02_FULL_55_14]HAV24157.1 50S ribosomal protein L17 [Bacteroidota bacterium]
MRHQKSGRKLKRTASHRKATLSALSAALFRHKRITTTTAKAKEMRMVVERLITKAKNAVALETGVEPKKNVHARRLCFAFLRDRDAVTTLFNDIAPKVAGRPGGYTRVVKLGRRMGDGAEMAVIELVDFNVAGEKAASKPAAKAAAAGSRTKKSKQAAAAKDGATASAPAKDASKEAAAHA